MKKSNFHANLPRHPLRNLAVLLLVLGWSAQAIAQTVAVTGGTVYSGVGEPIENATILVRDGKITRLGQNLRLPRGAEIIDATGKTIIPGMMDNHSHIGAKLSDLNDFPMTIGPQHRVLDALVLDDKEWADAIKGGVTTVVTGPGSGETVSGQAVVIKTFGDGLDDRVINENGGMKFAMGPKSKEKYPTTAMGVAASLRSYLYKTQEYQAKRQAWEEGSREEAPPPRDLGYEAMGDVLNDKNRVRAHVHSAADVQTLLTLKDEFGFDLTLHHSTEAYKLANEIAAREVNAVVVPLGPRIGLTEDTMEGPYHLWKAGVRVALHTDHPVQNQKWLRLNAGLVMRYGVPELEALKMITIHPAQIARVDDRIGSIEAGKDADFVVLNGPWYEPMSRIELVFGNGEVIYNISEEDE